MRATDLDDSTEDGKAFNAAMDDLAGSAPVAAGSG